MSKKQLFNVVAVLIVILALTALHAGAIETKRWAITVNQTATAASYTSHWDVDGDGYESGCDGVGVETGCEVTPFTEWTVYNPDSADIVYCDANSHLVAGVMTQNAAVNDGTKPTSIPIPAVGGRHTFTQKFGARSTISCVCTAGQTCTGVIITASESN